MKVKGSTKFVVKLATLALALGLFVWSSPAVMAADHRDAPLVDGIPEGDLTDIYVFTDPNDASRVVFIMSVNPFANPAELPSYSFSPDLLYQFKIDNTGDSREDLVIQIVFDTTGQSQKATVFGPGAPRRTGQRNKLLEVSSASGKFNTVFGDPTGVLAFVGTRDDSFVFDVGQFFRIMNGSQDLFRQVGTFRGRPIRTDGTSGVDGFGGYDLTSIVISVPKSMIRGSGSKVNVWATVSSRANRRHHGEGGDEDEEDEGAEFVQFEREGQQGFSTLFIPGSMRDAVNAEIPEHDVKLYSGLIPDALTTTDNDGSGNTIANRAGLLTTLGLTTLPNGAALLLPPSFKNTSKDLLRVALLPDVLRLDLDLPFSNQAIGQFGLQNGRKLDDSDIDIALQLLRQLADVHFPSGVFGGGPLGSRVALDCTGFPNCKDRRVLAVVQGTQWIKPDSAVTDFTTEGNDKPFLTQFPYIAPPHPLPGSPGTIGYPAQQ